MLLLIGLILAYPNHYKLKLMAFQSMGLDDSTSVECLCVSVQGKKVGLAVSMVDYIGDFRLTPSPPMSHDWIVGLGLHDAQPFVVIDPSAPIRRHMTGSRRSRKCLVVGKEAGMALWGVQVDSIGGMEVLDVSLSVAMMPPGWNSPKGWVTTAMTAEGDEIPFIHLEQIAVEFELASSQV